MQEGAGRGDCWTFCRLLLWADRTCFGDARIGNTDGLVPRGWCASCGTAGLQDNPGCGGKRDVGNCRTGLGRSKLSRFRLLLKPVDDDGTKALSEPIQSSLHVQSSHMSKCCASSALSLVLFRGSVLSSSCLACSVDCVSTSPRVGLQLSLQSRQDSIIMVPAYEITARDTRSNPC